MAKPAAVSNAQADPKTFASQAKSAYYGRVQMTGPAPCPRDYRCTFCRAATTAADYCPGFDAGTRLAEQAPAGRSAGADGRAVAVDDLGLVLVPGRGRAIRVQDHGPAPLMDDNLVGKKQNRAQSLTLVGVAVGPVPQVVDLELPAGWSQPPGNRQC